MGTRESLDSIFGPQPDGRESLDSIFSSNPQTPASTQPPETALGLAGKTLARPFFNAGEQITGAMGTVGNMLGYSNNVFDQLSHNTAQYRDANLGISRDWEAANPNTAMVRRLAENVGTMGAETLATLPAGGPLAKLAGGGSTLAQGALQTLPFGAMSGLNRLQEGHDAAQQGNPGMTDQDAYLRAAPAALLDAATMTGFGALGSHGILGGVVDKLTGGALAKALPGTAADIGQSAVRTALADSPVMLGQQLAGGYLDKATGIRGADYDPISNTFNRENLLNALVPGAVFGAQDALSRRGMVGPATPAAGMDDLLGRQAYRDARQTAYDATAEGAPGRQAASDLYDAMYPRTQSSVADYDLLLESPQSSPIMQSEAPTADDLAGARMQGGVNDYLRAAAGLEDKAQQRVALTNVLQSILDRQNNLPLTEGEVLPPLATAPDRQAQTVDGQIIHLLPEPLKALPAPDRTMQSGPAIELPERSTPGADGAVLGSSGDLLTGDMKTGPSAQSSGLTFRPGEGSKTGDQPELTTDHTETANPGPVEVIHDRIKALHDLVSANGGMVTPEQVKEIKTLNDALRESIKTNELMAKHQQNQTASAPVEPHAPDGEPVKPDGAPEPKAETPPAKSFNIKTSEGDQVVVKARSQAEAKQRVRLAEAMDNVVYLKSELKTADKGRRSEDYRKQVEQDLAKERAAVAKLKGSGITPPDDWGEGDHNIEQEMADSGNRSESTYGQRLSVADASAGDGKRPVSFERFRVKLASHQATEYLKQEGLRRAVNNVANIHIWPDEEAMRKAEGDTPMDPVSTRTGKVEAMYDPASGKIHVFSDNIGSVDRALYVLRHEMRHRGMRGVFGNKLDRNLDAIYRDNKSEISDYVDRLNERREKAGLSTLDMSKPADVREMVDEWLAEVKGEQKAKQGSIGELVQSARNLLRKMGLDLKWSDSDILDLAGRSLEKGSRSYSGLGNDTASDNKPLFSLAPPKDSPEFKQWADGLPVIKSKSVPAVLRASDHAAQLNHLGPGIYQMIHATGHDFSTFDPKIGNSAKDLRGDHPFFFTPSPKWGAEFRGIENLADEVQKHIEQHNPKTPEEWQRLGDKTNYGYFPENQMPVFVKTEKPFRYWSDQDVSELEHRLQSDKIWARIPVDTKAEIAKGDWTVLENKDIQTAMRSAGFDGFFVNESNDHATERTKHQVNLAVFDPNNVKSMVGNIGSYGQRPVTADEAARLNMSPAQANAAQKQGDVRMSLSESGATDRKSVADYFPDPKSGPAKEAADLLRKAGEAIFETRDSLNKTVNAPNRSGEAKFAAQVIREHNAKRSRLLNELETQYAEVHSAFDKLPGDLTDPSGIKARFIDAIQSRTIDSLPAELQAPARDIVATEDRLLQMIQERGRLTGIKSSDQRGEQDDGSFIPNYFTGLWQKGNEDVVQRVMSDLMGKRPLQGVADFLKQKKYQYFKDGLAAGLKPLYDNPVDMLFHQASTTARWIMAHDIISEYKRNGLVKFIPAGHNGPEGWAKLDDPMFTVHGKPEQVGYRVSYTDENGDNHSKTFKPDLAGMSADDFGSMNKTQRGDAAWADARDKAGEFARQNNGTVSEHKDAGITTLGYYYMPEGAATVMRQFTSKGLRGHAAFRAFLGAGNIMNASQLGFSLFHAGFTSYDATISQFAVGLHYAAEGKIGEAAKAFAATPTAALTNARIGSKLVKAWNNPDLAEEVTYKGHNLADLYAQGGGRTRLDSVYRLGAIDKFKQALKNANYLMASVHAPVAGLELMSKPIMEMLVPYQKAGVFSQLAKMVIDTKPDLTHEQMRAEMAKIVDTVDNRMGQIVYDNLFWNKTFKDLAMASTRSVGWNLGTIREITGGVRDAAGEIRKLAKGERAELTTRMAYLVAMPMVTGMAGAMLQYLMTGKGPDELKDYFFPKTGAVDEKGLPERLSQPTYLKDLYHYSEEPGKTVTNKLHPLLSSISDMLQNKDFFGNKIYGSDDSQMQKLVLASEYLGKQMMPFGIRNMVKEQERGSDATKSALPFIGLTPAPSSINQSDADKLMAKYGEENKKMYGQEPEIAARSDAKQKITQALRRGDSAKAAEYISNALSDRTLIYPEVEKLINNLATPIPQQRFAKLSLEQQANVLAKATDEEKAQYLPLFLKRAEKDKGLQYGRGIKALDILS